MFAQPVRRINRVAYEPVWAVSHQSAQGRPDAERPLGRGPPGVQLADYEASDSVPLRCVVSILPLMAAPSETLIAGAEIPPRAA